MIKIHSVGRSSSPEKIINFGLVRTHHLFHSKIIGVWQRIFRCTIAISKSQCQWKKTRKWEGMPLRH